MSNFSGQSLSFPWGTTQACFNLTIGSDQSSLSYTLGIQGSTEELDITVDHHVTGFCGVISNPVNAQSPGSSSSSSAELLDRFGNSYTYEDLAINFGGLECTQSGYFALEFTSNFTPEEITTICSVFEYLSTLFVSQATEIPIRIRKDALFAGALAAGTEFYRADTDGGGCGIENSVIWEYINTDSDFGGILDDNYVVGRIDVSDTGSWHTLDMDTGPPNNPGVMNGDYDLYSIVLHEALHVLGFASRITADGSPLNGFYTAWDRELKGNTVSGYDDLLEGVTNGACCDDHSYNGLSSPNQISYDCNSVQFAYGTNEQATVWGEYDAVDFPSENSFIVNVLSHLNGDCDNADYVMVSELADATANRFVSTEEKGILCQLGYQVLDGGIPACSTACAVVAVNDLIFLSPDDLIVSGSPTPVYSVEIEYATITGNDFLPSGATVEVYACDPLINVIVVNDDPDDTKFSIRGFSPGQVFTVCYTISGCDGICDDAIVTIAIELSDGQVIVGSGPACGEQENIVGWSDFEDFMTLPGTGGYNLFFSQTTLQACDPFGTNLSGANTPGIRAELNGNLYAYMVGRFVPNQMNNNGTNCESIFLPLTQPIFPGCSITLEFDVHSRFHSAQDYSFLEFYGSFLPPCASNIFNGNCTASQSNNDIYCIRTGNDGFLITQNLEIGTTPSRFGPYTWTNNTGVPINYLIAYNNNAALGQDIEWTFPVNLDFGIDNVSVIQNCDNQLTITSNVLAACEDEGVIIDYQICLTGSSTGARDVNLTLDLPSLPGVLFGNGDFTSNQYTVTNVVPNGDCRPVRLVLDLNSSPLGAGDGFTVQLGGVALGTCIDDPNLTDVLLEECDNCDPLQTGYTFAPDCTAESITFTANNSAGIHSWIINEVTYQGNPLTIPINDLTNDENYTVEHIVLNECFDEFRSTEVDILIEACLDCDLIQAGFTYVQDCTTEMVTFTAINATGTHSWLINGTAYQGNPVTIPIAEPAMDDLYSVEHTVMNNCEETDVFFNPKFPVDACFSPLVCPCTGPNAVNVVAGTGTLWQNTPLAALAQNGLLSPNTIDLTNYCVTISGTLIVGPDVLTQSFQSDVLFTSGALRMLPDAEIVIENNASLMLFSVNEPDGQGAGLHGCEFMWQGITVETGGELRMYDSHIEDAEVAVQAFPGATLDIFDNDFVDNYVGLDIIGSVNNDPPGTVNVGINGIEKNLFDGMTGLLGTSNYSIQMGGEAHAGVRLNNVSFLMVGSFNGEGNFFRGLQHGVFSANSNYSFIQADMQDISVAGVSSTKDFVFFYDAKMERMPFGINIEAGSISARNNTMSQISDTGIRVFGADGMDVGVFEINNNTIDADRFCIDLTSTLDNNYLAVQGNQLTLTPLAANTTTYEERAAFRMLNAGADEASFNEQAQVRNNHINVHGAGIGIDIMDIGNINLHYNDITFYNPVEMTDGVYRGISLNDSDNNDLYENSTQVGIFSTDFNELVGYHFTACETTRLCCNSSDGGYIGFEFSENCMDTEWRTSEIFDHHTGLKINEASFIGTQSHAGNRWEGSYINGAEHLSTSTFIIGQSLFKIREPMTQPFWPPSISNAPGADWFLADNTANNALCATDTLCLPVPPPFNGLIKETDRFLAGTTYQGAPYESFHNWEGRKFLLAKLNANPSYGQGDQQFQQFRNTQNNSLLAGYLTLNAQMNVVHQGQTTQALAHLDAVKTHLVNLKNLETQYLQATTDTERADLQGDYADTNADIATELTQLRSLQQTAKTNREAAATNLITANDNLATPDIFTANQQTVNAIQLEVWAGILPALGSSEISTLEQIAYQCPLQGGNAVHRARAMLRGIGEYNFKGVNCISIQALQREDTADTPTADSKLSGVEDDVTNPSSWQIYPNPTSNYFQISGEYLDRLQNVELYNLSGKLHQTWAVASRGSNYQLQDNLVSGIYLLRLYLADGSQVNRKLVISK